MKSLQVVSTLAKILSFIQLILLAAIFGFFYAYACSAMWGLDVIDARAAIEAMNGINTVVRNAVFAPAFFGPIPMGIIGVILLWLVRLKRPALWFAFAVLTYICGAFLVTMSVSVPMNRELLSMPIPADLQDATKIWGDYSGAWQFWNWVRTGFSGLALVFASIGIFSLGGANRKLNARQS